jgi:hypothetical protein
MDGGLGKEARPNKGMRESAALGSTRKPRLPMFKFVKLPLIHALAFDWLSG